MTKTLRLLLVLVIPLFLLGFQWPTFLNPNSETLGTKRWVDREIALLTAAKEHADPYVLRLSLNAYLKARKQGLDDKQLLTVIDFTKPSSEKRLWVIDIKRAKALINTWVSHGKNSGKTEATSFSNSPGSLKSSLGVFVTDNDPYQGNHGYSLRLYGLEPGFNDKAYQRDIVIHGAWYVNEDVIKRYGAIGRSFGCPAVSEETIKPLIDTIKQHTLVVAYYPDANWLAHSNFLS